MGNCGTKTSNAQKASQPEEKKSSLTLLPESGKQAPAVEVKPPKAEEGAQETTTKDSTVTDTQKTPEATKTDGPNIADSVGGTAATQPEIEKLSADEPQKSPAETTQDVGDKTTEAARTPDQTQAGEGAPPAAEAPAKTAETAAAEAGPPAGETAAPEAPKAGDIGATEAPKDPVGLEAVTEEIPSTGQSKSPWCGGCGMFA